MIKLPKKQSEVQNLVRVAVSGTIYFFQGDKNEIQSICVQNVFDNFYPYQDTKLVNDLKAFDSSSVTNNVEDFPREIISLAGFSSVEAVEELKADELTNEEAEQATIDETQTVAEVVEQEEIIVEPILETPEAVAEEVTVEPVVEAEETVEETTEPSEVEEDYEVPTISKKSKKN